MLCMPEIRLKRVCEALLQYIVDDYNICIKEYNDETLSYLYLLFHEDSDDNTISGLYSQALTIFIENNKEENPRHIEVRPIFDPTRAGLPTIHIVVPQDSDDFNQLGDFEGGVYEKRIAPKLERGFMSQMGFIVTSENILECLIINYTLRALLIGSVDKLSYLGFINPKFSIQDLNIRPNVLPANVYTKGIMMSANYVDTFPAMGVFHNINHIIFEINCIKY